jgi:hypothetical protein
MEEGGSEYLLKMYAWRSNPSSRYYVKPDDYEIVPMKGSQVDVKKYNDKVVFPMFVHGHSFLKEFDVQSDDVYVIGYPKSGKTRNTYHC